MEEKNVIKIKFSTVIFIILVILLVVAVIGYYIINNSDNTEENEISSSNDINKENSLIEGSEKNIIGDVSYITISVDNSGWDGLSYTEPLYIYDKEIIEKVKKIINSSEDYTVNNPSGALESCPIVTLYEKDGKEITVVACDDFNQVGEKSGNIIKVTINDDHNMYEINEKLGAYIEQIYANKSDNQNSHITLYWGHEIQKKVGIQILADMEISDANMKKYNIPYYNYENGEYFGTINGDFGEETYEGVSIVNNVRDIAISKNYNAIPRKYKVINELPEELIDMADYSSVNIHEIDLDGDEKKEHIVCYTYELSAEDSDNNEPEASSGIILFDSNYKKIANLATIENGYWFNEKTEENKYLFSLDNIEYVDIDDDKIMEIIIDLPILEGKEISVIKYENGNITGEIDLKVELGGY